VTSGSPTHNLYTKSNGDIAYPSTSGFDLILGIGNVTELTAN
jgi:hypothetical protein